MPAGAVQGFTEVLAQARHLAAVVRDPCMYFVQPLDFALFARFETPEQFIGQSIRIRGRSQTPVGGANAGGAQFQHALLVQVFQRPYDALARLLQGGPGPVHVKLEPDPGLFGPAQYTLQECAPLPLETRQYFPRGHQRPEFVAVMERRARAQIAVQFQICKQCARGQDADVVPLGQDSTVEQGDRTAIFIPLRNRRQPNLIQREGEARTLRISPGDGDAKPGIALG